MSDLTFNKIAGGVLAAGLVIFGLREVTSIAFEKEPPEKAGYAITVAEEGGEGGGAAAEVAPDWGTVIPDPANIAAGQAVSAKCASCHTFPSGGPNGTGPNLFGALGKTPGTHPGFTYSAGMTGFGAGKTWTYDEMDAFLKAPQKHVPGTKMTFVGLKKQADRIAMIAYLHSLGSTLAVPAPKPAETAAAPAAPAEGAAPTPAAAAPAAAPAPAAH